MYNLNTGPDTNTITNSMGIATALLCFLHLFYIPTTLQVYEELMSPQLDAQPYDLTVIKVIMSVLE